jgi:hypothetical protein
VSRSDPLVHGRRHQPPVPLRLTFCGEPIPSSPIDSVAARLPAATGLNETLMVQLAPMASEDPHVVVLVNALLPVKVIPPLAIVAATLPVFFTVTVCALLVEPSAVAAKVRLAGETVSVAAPVPDKPTRCGELAALSAIESVAVRDPAAVGLKVMLMVQLAPTASEDPQVVVLVNEAAAVPVSMIPPLVSAIATAPVFLTVMVCAALAESTAVAAKLKLSVDTNTNGGGAPPWADC